MQEEKNATMDTITKEKLDKYFVMTEEALKLASRALMAVDIANARAIFLDTIQRYLSDAHHFAEKGDRVAAFAALNYAHGWLDAGARLGLWKVTNSHLFAGVEDVSGKQAV